MKLLQSFKKDWDYYIGYIGIAIIVVSLIINRPDSRYFIGFGIALLTAGFIRRRSHS